MTSRLPFRSVVVSGASALAAVLVGQVPPATAVPKPTAAAALDLAFAVTERMPTVPHQKNRARLQEQLVEAALAAGDTGQALAFARRIDDWRRGTALAAVACAELVAGRRAEVAGLLQEAEAVAAAAQGTTQAWRIDRIRAGIARAELLRGDPAAARSRSQGIAAADLMVVERELARVLPIDDFAAELAKLDAIFAAEQFEPIQNALAVCVIWFERFHADQERRAAMQRRVHTAYTKLPPAIRVDAQARLAEAALRCDDRAAASEALTAAEGLCAPTAFLPEDGLPMRARLAGLRGVAGDGESARRTLDGLLAEFHVARDRIVDIQRARVLRAFAAARHRLGDQAGVESLLLASLGEGMVNPNGRPRLEDFVALVGMLAESRQQPSPVLWTRLQQIAKEIGQPW